MIYFGQVRDSFTGFEIRPLRITRVADEFCKALCEECPPGCEPDFWSVYTVSMDNTLDCIADLDTEPQAKSLVALLESIRAQK
jgi:hypothetical protein